MDDNLSVNDTMGDRETSDVIANVKQCLEAINLDAALTYQLQQKYWVKRTCMFSAEDSLLSLASTGVMDGIFYCAVLHINLGESKSVYLARFFQFGKFECFMETFFDDVKDFVGCSELLPYSVYTNEDVVANSERESNLYTDRRKSDGSKTTTAFQRKLFSRKNGFANSIKKIIKELEDVDNVDCVFMLAFCIDKNPKFAHSFDKDGNSKHRYFVSYPEHLFSTWEEKLMLFRSNPLNKPQRRSFWKTIETTPNMEEQYFLLSSLPNFHKWVWNNKSNSDLRYEQRLSTSCRYYPGSPRNRIVQAICYRDNPWPIVQACMLHIAGADVIVPYENSTLQGMKHKTVKGVIDQVTVSSECIDEVPNANENPQLDDVTVSIECMDDTPNSNENPQLDDITVSIECTDDTPNSNENPQLDDVTVTIECTDDTPNSNENPQLDDVTDTPNSNENPQLDGSKCITEHRPSLTLYQHFCYELFAGGVLKWRKKDDSLNVVVMNNYGCETGDFQPNEYVHVTAEFYEDTIYRCTCNSYTTCLQNAFSEVGESVQNISCCHCQLLKDVISFLNTDEISHNECINKEVVSSGLTSTAANVILLPSKFTEKYSVASEESVEFVHLFTVPKTGRRIVACQSKLCALTQGAKRSINNLNTGALCSHLKVFKYYYQLVENLIESDESEEENNDSRDCLDGEDDESITINLPNSKHEDVFNETTGLWNFSKNSSSQRTVSRDPYDESLKKNIEVRYRINVIEYEPGSLSFSPRIEEVDCDCGAGWSNSTYPNGFLIYSHNTNLYLDRRAICCRVFQLICLEKRCFRIWDGENDSIFRLSRSVCAGYELGWEFVDIVMSSKGTFRGFVTSYNNKYKRGGSEIPFMSLQTFIDWFFGWASRMKFDFRQQCNWCGSTPTILACDGTKIGIGFKNTFVSPIEVPTFPDGTIKTPNRRHQRCFIVNKKGKPARYSEAREQLKVISDSVIQEKAMAFFDVNLKEFLPIGSHAAFDAMMEDNTQIHDRKLFAKVFKLLSSDASLDTILPLQICHRASEFCRLSTIGELSIANRNQFLRILRNFCPEFADLLVLNSEAANNLLSSCAATVLSYHANDIEPAEPSVITPYNPAKYGRAYYFHQHGAQIRHVRKFSIDNDAAGNYDDLPSNACVKKYPEVRKKGVSYLFLWFCPQHGHCYGYHMIPGCEGRKDPAASLYAYLEKAPAVVMYDFACSLSEYCHNRESGYFKNTRFFHDVFHGFSHKCTKAFCCSRIRSFDFVNSSICEQFNSFLQNIKVSARLMSQAHFAFYVQFFISIWNDRKSSTYQKRLGMIESLQSGLQ